MWWSDGSYYCVPYDGKSIMHYSSVAYAKKEYKGHNTIESKVSKLIDSKYLYLLPLLWSKTTVIARCMGGRGTNPPFQLCKFSTKNLIRHEMWKLSNFGQISKKSTTRVR